MATGAALSGIFTLYNASRAYDLFKEHRDGLRSVRSDGIKRFEDSLARSQELNGYLSELFSSLDSMPEYELCDSVYDRAKTSTFAQIRPSLERFKGVTHRSMSGERCRAVKDLYIEASKRAVNQMVVVKGLEKSIYDAYLDLQGISVMNSAQGDVYSSFVANSSASLANSMATMLSAAEKSVEGSIYTLGYSVGKLINEPPVQNEGQGAARSDTRGVRPNEG